MATQELVNQQLRHAVENGYSFDGWTADEIASDLIAYSEDFFDVPPAIIIPLVEVWQRQPLESMCNEPPPSRRIAHD